METKCVLTGFAIVVADRGFVYVGNVEVTSEYCIMSNAKNIRRWGTSKGLGELALNGPQSETKLDDVGSLRIFKHAVNHIIDTDESKWK